MFILAKTSQLTSIHAGLKLYYTIVCCHVSKNVTGKNVASALAMYQLTQSRDEGVVTTKPGKEIVPVQTNNSVIRYQPSSEVLQSTGLTH